VTRVAAYGSYAWRNWKQNHHWTTSGAPADPLGAGNTQLLSDLAVTPKVFHDVRKSLALSGSTPTALGDVSGVGTYGPSLTVSGSGMTWDGTTLKTNGTGYLLSASAVTGLDLSTQITIALIADIGDKAGGAVPLQIGAAANAAPWLRLNNASGTGVPITINSSSHGAGTASTAVTGTGNIRLIIGTINVVGTDAQSIEVPATAKVSGTTATALASGNQLVAIGATTSGTSNANLRFRALIAWAGGYTTAQKNTLITYAQTYHSMVLA